MKLNANQDPSVGKQVKVAFYWRGKRVFTLTYAAHSKANEAKPNLKEVLQRIHKEFEVSVDRVQLMHLSTSKGKSYLITNEHWWRYIQHMNTTEQDVIDVGIVFVRSLQSDASSDGSDEDLSLIHI